MIQKSLRKKGCEKSDKKKTKTRKKIKQKKRMCKRKDQC